MNKYKKLAKDSIVYIMGNIGSKIVSLLMVTLYTYALSKEEYGYIDVTQTTISLLIPLVSLGVYEAVFRYTLRCNDFTREEIVSNGLSILLLMSIPAIPICFLLYNIIHLNGNVILIICILLADCFNELSGQICRGLEKSKLYAITGVVTTFVIAGSNIVFLTILKIGVSGYYLSLLFGATVSAVIRFWGGSIYRYINLHTCRWKTYMYLLKYSIPLIPNSIMWWIMNAADKYTIIALLTPADNGLYSVAQKIPQIIYTFSHMFIQAWQISAVHESNSKDKSVFFTKVFDLLSAFLFVLISVIILFLKPFMSIYVSSEYYDSWKIIPFLLFSTTFSCFSAFLGANYVAMEKTIGASKTVAIGAVINVFLNIIFISLFGVIGAAIATACSFTVVWFIRIKDTKSFVKIRYDVVRIILSLLLIAIEIVTVYCLEGWLSYVINSICFLIILVVSRRIILEVWRKIKKNANRTSQK